MMKGYFQPGSLLSYGHATAHQPCLRWSCNVITVERREKRGEEGKERKRERAKKECEREREEWREEVRERERGGERERR